MDDNPSTGWLGKLVRRVVGAIIVLTPVFFGVGGWIFSNQIRDEALHVDEQSLPEYDLGIVAIADGIVTLAVPSDPKDDLFSNEIIGLEWARGYGQVSGVVSSDGTTVARRYQHISGRLPETGDRVRLDGFAYPENPETAHGIPYSVVSFDAEFATFPAWYVEGDRSTWVIFVHGRGAHPREALRILPTFVDEGFPTLAIFYRNDPGVPATDDRLARFGLTEWEDLQGAVQYALDEGAEDVVLVGFSMGGAITTSFMYRSPLADHVRALIMDSPALDLEIMIDDEARQSDLPLLPIRVPGPLISFSKAMASWRFDLDWDDFDHLARTVELEVPILLIHGTEDLDVPVDISDALAADRPDLVSYLRVPEAGHVRAWNVDRVTYETAVREFLRSLGG